MSSGLRISALALLLVCIPLCEHRGMFPEKIFFGELPAPEITAATGPISPYDDLLKKYADTLGWDWRLLAAVIYRESRFHSTAQSPKGAVGLMQIRSERYTEEELLDPETNLMIGTRYLKRLEAMFPGASPVEGIKFTLAAYNLGEGKVGRLIERAGVEGIDNTRWDSVAALLPKGHHTVCYVNNVLATFDEYSKGR